MLTFALYLSSLLHLLSTTTNAVAAAAPPYTPTDYFLLNCGASSNETSEERTWDADSQSRFSPANIATTSFAATTAEGRRLVPKVPYMTARIFYTQFTYIFPVSPAQKFIRFYFYPVTYSGIDTTQLFFSVTVNNHTLLQNFSAFLTINALDTPVYSLIKEFVVNVRDTQRLEITFSPSLNSFAFVNGIEVVSMPENLYIGKTDNPFKYVAFNNLYYIDNYTAIETLYRLNVGGNRIPIANDTGMFRSWEQDDLYVVGPNIGVTPQRSVPIHYSLATPAYIAPEVVYTTSRTMGNLSLLYNLTWSFSVDSGFHYLVRLHFCEIQLEVTLENQRVFFILMNNQTAEKEADVIRWSGGTGNPIFRDYIVWVPQLSGGRVKQGMWLMMYPNPNNGAQYRDALLNGLEMFKLKSDGSLAGSNPELILDPTSPNPNSPGKSSKSKSPLMLGGVIGGVIGGVFVIAVLGLMVFRRRKKMVKEFDELSKTKSSGVQLSDTSRSTKTIASSLPSDLCRHFSLAEIKSGTANFDGNFVIGTGGFGNVYKGYINDGCTTVAIKRLNPSSNQGAREFQTEILMLSKLRHLHLVSLIGYCDEEGEMILVYDYMANGTLRDHLYRTNNPPLTWKQRLEICIGVARGLHYLHTGSKDMIIHRDVKSTNILLDEKWVAKVADFGLSKIGPTNMSHISTDVKGSFGYLDPEYFRRQQLTVKSDVYSFGVVLFEVLCARPVILPTIPTEQVCLAEWGWLCYQRGTVDKIVDPNLRGQIAPECLKKYVEIAESCLRDQGIERPTIGDVVQSLEFALQLQEDAEKNIDGIGHVMNVSWGPVSTSNDNNNELLVGSREHVSESTISSDELKSQTQTQTQTLLSEIMNPNVREK